jgi:hypothetical protein
MLPLAGRGDDQAVCRGASAETDIVRWFRIIDARLTNVFSPARFPINVAVGGNIMGETNNVRVCIGISLAIFSSGALFSARVS